MHDQLPSSGGKRKNLLHEVVLASHVSLDQACAVENVGTISSRTTCRVPSLWGRGEGGGRPDHPCDSWPYVWTNRHTTDRRSIQKPTCVISVTHLMEYNVVYAELPKYQRLGATQKYPVLNIIDKSIQELNNRCSNHWLIIYNIYREWMRRRSAQPTSSRWRQYWNFGISFLSKIIRWFKLHSALHSITVAISLAMQFGKPSLQKLRLLLGWRQPEKEQTNKVVFNTTEWLSYIISVSSISLS